MTNRLTDPAAPATYDRCAARLAFERRPPMPPNTGTADHDWQCVRASHRGRPVPAAAEHLAMPAGPTGRSIRFDDSHAEYPAKGTADDPADTTPDEPPGELLALVDQLARRNVGVVRAQPGDTLLLLVPNYDPEHSDELVQQAAACVPQIAVLALFGVVGGVVVPPAEAQA